MFDKLPIPVMKGATAGAAGKRGRVPAPAAGDHGKYLRGDGTWATGAVGGDMVAANNLSDLANKTTAVTNLGIVEASKAPRPGIISAGTSAVGTTQDNAGLAFGTGDLSIGAWVRLPDWTPSTTIPIVVKIGSNLGLLLELQTSGVLQLRIGNGSNFLTHIFNSTVAVGLVDGAWTFIAVSMDRDGNAVFSVNGAQLGAAVSMAAASAQTLTNTGVMYWGDGNSARITGTLGETFIVGGVLTATRIAEIYKAGSIAPFCAYTANSTTGQNTSTIDTFSFFQWCDFGQGYGPIIKDRSGNNQHALMGTTGLTHAVTRNPPGIPQRAPKAALVSDGTTTNYVRAALNAQDPAAGDFTLWWDGIFPTPDNITRGLAALASSTQHMVQQGAFWLSSDTGAGVQVALRSPTDAGHYRNKTNVPLASMLAGKRAVFCARRSAAALSIFMGIDGEWLDVSNLFVEYVAGASAPAWSATVAGAYLYNISPTYTPAVSTYDLRLANVAMTEAQLRAEYERGEPGTEWSGATKTAKYTSDFSSGVDSWLAVNTGSIAAASSKLEITGNSNSTSGATRALAMSRNATYRLRFTHRLQSGSGVPWELREGDSDQLSAISGALSFTPTAVEATHEIIVRSGSGTIGSLYFKHTGGTATAVIEISNMTVEQVGYTSRLRTDTAAGFTALDGSTNKNDFLLSTSGVTTSPNGRTQIIRASTNTNGNQQLFGASVIDTSRNWRIRSWHVVTTGTPTISLGSASGGAQYVSALALSASILTDITLLARYALSANLWCASNSTATVNHVIILDLVD
jgi:hypothetical protein